MEELPELNVGVIGHIDHGKTTLLNSLTGKFADTHSEELKRGITIKLGYADTTIYESNGKYNNKKEGKGVCYISFIDSPGHQMLLMTMLSGAALIDAAILVVAANEGIKPQTKEHFSVLKFKNIKTLIVVQNKIDLVDEKQALKSYKEIKEFLKGSQYEDAPIIPVSAQQGINIDKIFEELVKIKSPKKDTTSSPIFLIARSFDINYPGSSIEKLKGGVFGGVLKKGTLKIGDEIEIKPGIKLGKKEEYKTVNTKIVSLHRGKDTLEKIHPGVSIAIETELDPFVTKADSLTGQVLSKKGSLPEPSYNLKIKIKYISKEHSDVKTKESLIVSINTTLVVGIVQSVNEEVLEIDLVSPIIRFKGDSVGVSKKINGLWTLIGFGDVI